MTLNYREGYPGLDILRPTEGLERGGVSPNERVRDVYVRRTSERSDSSGVGGYMVGGFAGGYGGYGAIYDATSYTSTASSTAATTAGPYSQRQFRMIDASAADLRDPIDRTRRYSSTSGGGVGGVGGGGGTTEGTTPSASAGVTASRGSRFGSFSSDSTIKSGGSPGTMAIETSFCGPKPIAPEPSFDMGTGAAHTSSAASMMAPTGQDVAAVAGMVGSAASRASYMYSDRSPVAPSASTGAAAPPSRTAVGSRGSLNSPSTSDDGRNLVEEINRRSQLPLTKQVRK